MFNESRKWFDRFPMNTDENWAQSMKSPIISFQRSVRDWRSRLSTVECLFSDELDKPDLEKRLRDLHFGYRARYIEKAIQYLKYSVNDSTYFDRLKALPVKEARQQLLKIMGVGRKVRIGLESIDVVLHSRRSRLPIVFFWCHLVNRMWSLSIHTSIPWRWHIMDKAKSFN